VAVKKFMYINRKAPYGTVYALESLEVVLIAAAFEQAVSVAFLDDGVYQLLQGQQPQAVGMKNFSATFRALGDYDVRHIYVEQESLQARGLCAADLMPLTYEDEADDYQEKSSIHLVSRQALTALIAEHDVVLSF